MAREPEHQDEVALAKARLLAAAARPATLPTAFRVVPGVLGLFRRGRNAGAGVRRQAPVLKVKGGGSSSQRPLLKLAGIAAGAFALGLIVAKKNRKRT